MSIYNHKQHYPKGSLVQFEIESELLKSNPLKDPHTRTIYVYLPASYDHSEDDHGVYKCDDGDGQY